MTSMNGFARRAVPGLLALIGLLALTFAPAATVRAQDPIARFDAFAQQALTDWGVPGMSVAVVKDDRVVLAKGYGVRELGGHDAVDEHTLFQVGSTTKAFTVAALGLLVDEGKLSWDDPVVKYLPEFQMPDAWVTRELTVRDILTHRSGLAEGAGSAFEALSFDRREVIRRVRHLPVASSLRTHFAYNNVMYAVAGQIVEAISGQRWEDFVKQRIWDPLGMAGSNFGVELLPTLPNVAAQHMTVTGKLQRIPWVPLGPLGPAGALNSSATDMARWLRLQLGGGQYDGRTLLKPATVKEMQAAQMVIPLDQFPWGLVYSHSSFVAYGLGWFTYDYAGRKVVEHSGDIGGMTSIVAMMPAEGLGLVVLTNNDNLAFRYLMEYEFFDLFLGRPDYDWSGELKQMWQGALAMMSAEQTALVKAHQAGTKPSLDLAAYAGIYHSDAYGEATLALRDGKLTLDVGPNRGELTHWHYDTFRTDFLEPNLPPLVTFDLDAFGRVSRMETPNMGAFTRAP